MRPGLAGIAGQARGMGGPGSPSPLGGRGYRPPSVIGKRNVDGGEMRVPLNDLPANGAIAAGGGDGPDVKRVKM